MKLVKLSTIAALLFALAAQSALAEVGKLDYEGTRQGQISCQRRLAENKKAPAPEAPSPAERPAESHGAGAANGAQ